MEMSRVTCASRVDFLNFRELSLECGGRFKSSSVDKSDLSCQVDVKRWLGSKIAVILSQPLL